MRAILLDHLGGYSNGNIVRVMCGLSGISAYQQSTYDVVVN